jgi:SAM-dependent methyltransferase
MTQRQIATYILFQRTGLQRLGRIRLLRRFVPYKTLVGLEALLFHRGIIQRYRSQLRWEWDEFRPYLPDKVAHVLDIGCGLGGIHEFLFKHYEKEQPPQLFLVDYERIERKIHYGYKVRGAAYSSLQLARAYLSAQGIAASKVHTVNVECDPLPDGVSFDVVLALLSWGFHYPINTYLDYVKEHLSPSGVIIVDCRQGTDGLDILRQTFTINVISESSKMLRLACTTAR